MISFTILGQPCSKANSRRLVQIAGRPAFIKSAEALAYERSALPQIPRAARQRLQGKLRLTAWIYYVSERPDLDASLIRDVLQDRYAKTKRGSRVLVQAGVYLNDRQVREEHYYHAIDKKNPRAEIEVELIDAELPL